MIPERVHWRTVLIRALERFTASSPGRLDLSVRLDLKLEAQSAFVRCPIHVLEGLLTRLLETLAAFTCAGNPATLVVCREEEKDGQRLLIFELSSLEAGAPRRQSKSILSQFGRFGWRLMASRRRAASYGGSLDGERSESRMAGAVFRLRLPLVGFRPQPGSRPLPPPPTELLLQRERHREIILH